MSSDVGVGLTSATRRTVVAAGVAGVAVVAAPDIAEAAEPPRRSRFEKLVGETFVATRQGKRIRLRLDAVDDAASRPRGLRGPALARWRRKSFVLVLSTRADIEQGTWTLKGSRTGRFRLFVVPGQHRDRRGVVTASFNGWRG